MPIIEYVCAMCARLRGMSCCALLLRAPSERVSAEFGGGGGAFIVCMVSLFWAGTRALPYFMATLYRECYWPPRSLSRCDGVSYQAHTINLSMLACKWPVPDARTLAQLAFVVTKIKHNELVRPKAGRKGAEMASLINTFLSGLTGMAFMCLA